MARPSKLYRDISSCDDKLSNEISCALDGPTTEPKTPQQIRQAIHDQYAWHRDTAILLGSIDKLFDLNKAELKALLKNAAGSRAVIIRHLLGEKR